jgi:hypothetical protein
LMMMGGIRMLPKRVVWLIFRSTPKKK